MKRDAGATIFGFVLGVAATLVVFWLVISGLRWAVVLVVPTASISTREAGHGSAFYRTSPGDCARRGSHYLSIGSFVLEGRRSLYASALNDAAMVLPPAKQYGVTHPPTLPIDSNFLTSSSRTGRTGLGPDADPLACASLPAEANRGTTFLHKREIPRPVVDRRSAPGRAVSPGVEPGA